MVTTRTRATSRVTRRVRVYEGACVDTCTPGLITQMGHGCGRTMRWDGMDGRGGEYGGIRRRRGVRRAMRWTLGTALALTVQRLTHDEIHWLLAASDPCTPGIVAHPSASLFQGRSQPQPRTQTRWVQTSRHHRHQRQTSAQTVCPDSVPRQTDGLQEVILSYSTIQYNTVQYRPVQRLSSPSVFRTHSRDSFGVLCLARG